jgi:tRNA 2-thiouridine synthesizing protein A
MRRHVAGPTFDPEVSDMDRKSPAAVPTGVPVPPAFVSAAPSAGERFVNALGERDFPRLSSCLADDARFRALVPGGLREAIGSVEPVRFFQAWFGSADRVEVLDREVGTIADRVHLAWRFRVHDASGVRLIEQHAFISIQDDRIMDLDLLCSGFRCEEPSSGRASASAAGPAIEAAAQLDGGAAGCATLTPLVKAKLRDLSSGQVLEIVSSEPTAAQDLAAWSALTGHPLIATRIDGERKRFYVRKR